MLFCFGMPPLKLRQMTWTEVEALDRSRVAALMPVGAIEAHGPHLPLITDGIIAHSMANAAAARLEQADLIPLLLPPLDYSAAPFAASFPGTVSVSPQTITNLIVDVAESLETWGIPVVALANAHLDPAHLGALHAATAAVRERQKIQMVFPDLTRRPWGSRLTEEFRSGACHAGQFEGSVILAARPEWVREEIRTTLPANPISLSQAIREGISSFEEAGGPQAYFGDPAAATWDEGESTIQALGQILADAVFQELGMIS
jgi:creatinine amidohydrolase